MSCLIRAKSHQKQPHRSHHSADTAVYCQKSTVSEADGLTHLVNAFEATEGSQAWQLPNQTTLLNKAHLVSSHAPTESACQITTSMSNNNQHGN